MPHEHDWRGRRRPAGKMPVDADVITADLKLDSLAHLRQSTVNSTWGITPKRQVFFKHLFATHAIDLSAHTRIGAWVAVMR